MAETARSGRLEGLAVLGRALPGPEPVLLRALPWRGLLMLRGGPEIAAGVARVIGCALPERLRGAAGSDVEALWLGPDTWLLQTDLPAAAGLEQGLRAALGGTHHAVVDVSHRFAGIGIDGSRARDVLAAGCLLDLHPRAFPPGAVARTLLGKATVILTKRHEYRFEFLVDGSLAPYAWQFLENAAREHGYRVVT